MARTDLTLVVYVGALGLLFAGLDALPDLRRPPAPQGAAVWKLGELTLPRFGAGRDSLPPQLQNREEVHPAAEPHTPEVWVLVDGYPVRSISLGSLSPLKVVGLVHQLEYQFRCNLVGEVRECEADGQKVLAQVCGGTLVLASSDARDVLVTSCAWANHLAQGAKAPGRPRGWGRPDREAAPRR